MGVAAAWAPYIAAALAAGASYVNTEKTAHAQDQTIAAGIRQRSERQKEIDARTGQLVSDIGKSNPAQDVQDKLSKYLNVLTANKANANSGLSDLPGASTEYQQGAANAKGGIGDYGNKVADLFSRIDAPQAQRTREGVMASDYGISLDQIKRASSGEDFLNSLKLQAIRRNPLLDAFAAAAQSYAANSGSGASYGGAGSSPYAATSVLGGGRG